MKYLYTFEVNSDELERLRYALLPDGTRAPEPILKRFDSNSFKKFSLILSPAHNFYQILIPTRIDWDTNETSRIYRITGFLCSPLVLLTEQILNSEYQWNYNTKKNSAWMQSESQEQLKTVRERLESIGFENLLRLEFNKKSKKHKLIIADYLKAVVCCLDFFEQNNIGFDKLNAKEERERALFLKNLNENVDNQGDHYFSSVCLIKIHPTLIENLRNVMSEIKSTYARFAGGFFNQNNDALSDPEKRQILNQFTKSIIGHSNCEWKFSKSKNMAWIKLATYDERRVLGTALQSIVGDKKLIELKKEPKSGVPYVVINDFNSLKFPDMELLGPKSESKNEFK